MNFNETFANPEAAFPAQAAPPTLPGAGVETPLDAAAPPLYSDEELLALWEEIKEEAFADRWVFEKQWQRNLWYVLNRMWIEYISKTGGWRDKRMASWIPRPVTPKCKEIVQVIRAMFTTIQLGVNVRPNGTKPENVAAAATADELAPVLHEVHDMNHVQSEFDFWLIATGNAFMHTYLDYDVKYGTIDAPVEQCVGCGQQTPSNKLAGAQPTCPGCGAHDFQPATDPVSGQPVPPQQQTKGKAVTIALSPLEMAFPNSVARFSDLPYVVRLRWRTKRYFEKNAALKALMPKIVWQKAPTEQTLNLYTSLSKHNDLGITPVNYSEGSGGAGTNEDGVTEYEVWMKPTDTYPDGLVFRIYGDSKPQVAHLEDTESVPGPLPYTDAEGKPLFTFTHAGYEHVGGRVLASGALDPIIPKQDQLNRMDSRFELIIDRMANPVWVMPKGAEINKLTGMPGLVVRYDSLVLGGNAKPERVAGMGPDQSLFEYRQLLVKEIDELAGISDPMKGAKPAGVSAFSAMQLLVERAQARFAHVFQSRGSAYKDWFSFALELEREFGPEERTKAVLSDARTWTFKTFKKTQLQGSVNILVEDGTMAPKTQLGIRAAVDHAAQLGILNMADPDTQYESLKLFGLTRMLPTLDINIQAALQKQQAFEEWVTTADMQQFAVQAQQEQAQYQQQMAVAATQPPGSPVPPAPSPLTNTPLKWLPWYNPVIHRQELIKWANGDTIRDLMTTNPQVEVFLTLHLQEIEQHLQEEAMKAMAMQAGPPAPPQGAQGGPQGAARGMRNSNQNSGHQNNEGDQAAAG
jgi:hypothetical protein